MYEEDEDDDLTNLDRGDQIDEDEDRDDEDENSRDTDEDNDEDRDEDESDSEEDSSDDDEDSDEDVEEEETPKKRKPIYVPKERLDEVRQREIKLQEQLDKVLAALLEKEQSAKKEKEIETPAYDFDAAEEEYISMVIEGETQKASAKRREINQALEAKMKAMLSQSQQKDEDVKKAIRAEMEEKDFHSLVTAFETQYSFLNPESKRHNEEAVETVNTLMRGYMAGGDSKTKALEKAVKKTVLMYDQEAKPVKKSIGQERKEQANKKAIATSKSQPMVKSSSKSNIDLTKVNPKDIKDKDLFSLSKDELRRMRGDYL